MASGFSILDNLNKNSAAEIKETPTARFRTKDIPISKIYPNDLNFYSVADIEQLAEEILMCGLKQNLEVIYDPEECKDHQYRLISGERRLRALNILVSQGYQEFEIVTCKISAPQDANEEQIELIIANSYRNKTVGDMIEEEQRLKTALEKLKNSGGTIKGYDLTTGRLRDTIANMTGHSKTKIAQIESIANNLISEFREEINQEKISFSAAYVLSGMDPDRQRALYQKYINSGELTFTELKEIKEKEEKITGELTAAEPETIGSEISPAFVDAPPTTGDYHAPHPEGITSLCYSCKDYSDCPVKSGTCTACDQYINKNEFEKTDQQRYDDQQAAIERETNKRLREITDAEKMNHLPSDDTTGAAAVGPKVHHIKCAISFLAAVEDETKPFELRKNDRNYRVGDYINLMGFANGKHTGKDVTAEITYLLDGCTGLEDGYCILGIRKISPMGKYAGNISKCPKI